MIRIHVLLALMANICREIAVLAAIQLVKLVRRALRIAHLVLRDQNAHRAARHAVSLKIPIHVHLVRMDNIYRNHSAYLAIKLVRLAKISRLIVRLVTMDWS
jgi:hypothetical protein